MGDRYRLIVERIGDELDEPLVELTGSAAHVLRFGSVLVTDTVREDAAERGDEPAVQWDAPGVAATGAADEPERPKRRRRTKVEIAADEAAARANGATDAADVAASVSAPAESVAAAVAEPGPATVPYDPFAAR